MVEIRTREVEPGTVVVSVDGTLDLDAAPTLRESLHSTIQNGGTNLVVDLVGVDVIDSTALGALISGLKAARKNGGNLRIAGPGEKVQAMLELTGLDRVFKPEDTPLW